jgi:hypothetical protein
MDDLFNYLFRSTKTLYKDGTRICINKEKRSIKIEHAGNMGTRIDKVKENVDHVLGKNMFDNLFKQAKLIDSKGDPDYLYVVVFKF